MAYLTYLLLATVLLQIFVHPLGLSPHPNRATVSLSLLASSESASDRLNLQSSRTTRRSFFGGIALVPVLGFYAPVYAEVSAGNSLPEGAKQFASLLKAQKDTADVIKSLGESERWRREERFSPIYRSA